MDINRILKLKLLCFYLFGGLRMYLEMGNSQSPFLSFFFFEVLFFPVYVKVGKYWGLKGIKS